MSMAPSERGAAGNQQQRRRARLLAAAGVVGVVGLIGAGVVVLGGAGRRGDGGPEKKADKRPQSAAEASRTRDMVEVTTMDFDVTTTATGELRARNQVEIRNPLETETTITEIIAEGTTVKAGDVLIKLNAETIQTRLDEETLQTESARAALIDATEGYLIQQSENDSSKRAAELKLALAELDLEQWRQGEVESKRQEFDASLERTTKDELRLKEKLDKSRSLQERGYYSLDQLKQDELAWEQAKAALEKAKLDKQVYWEFQHPKDKRKKESDVEEARAELARVERQNVSKMASKEADRTNKRQALAIREQTLKKYKDQVESAVIKAPRDGLVVFSTSMQNAGWGGDDGPLQVGSKVYRNMNLIVLPDTSEMVAAVRVHESLAGRIKPGQPATVKIDAAGGDRFTGKVESIGILAEQTGRWMDPNLREYTVRVLLDLPPAQTPVAGAKAEAPTHGLKPSMRAEAEIVLGRVTSALAVPMQAVFSDGLVRYVHVDAGGKFVRRPVGIGQRSDRFAEVKVGLKEGERVLLRKPEPTEVLGTGWDSQQLAAVGLMMNDQGQVVPVGGGPGGPGGARRGPGAGGAPAASGAAPSASAPVPAAKAPAPATADSKGVKPS